MSASSLHGCRVLVLQEGDAAGTALEHMLADIGCDIVAIVTSPVQALAALSSGAAVDVGIIVIGGQAASVFGIADELARRSIPALFVSFYVEAAIIARYGEAPILRCPVERAALVRALAACCRPVGPAAAAARR